MPIRNVIDALSAVAQRPSIAITFLALFLAWWTTTTIGASVLAMQAQMAQMAASYQSHDSESRAQTRVLRAMCINWAPTADAQQRCLLE